MENPFGLRWCFWTEMSIWIQPVKITSRQFISQKWITQGVSCLAVLTDSDHFQRLHMRPLIDLRKKSTDAFNVHFNLIPYPQYGIRTPATSGNCGLGHSRLGTEISDQPPRPHRALQVRLREASKVDRSPKGSTATLKVSNTDCPSSPMRRQGGFLPNFGVWGPRGNRWQ